MQLVEHEPCDIFAAAHDLILSRGFDRFPDQKVLTCCSVRCLTPRGALLDPLRDHHDQRQQAAQHQAQRGEQSVLLNDKGHGIQQSDQRGQDGS